jgi:hypothetical protein
MPHAQLGCGCDGCALRWARLSLLRVAATELAATWTVAQTASDRASVLRQLAEVLDAMLDSPAIEV